MTSNIGGIGIIGTRKAVYIETPLYSLNKQIHRLGNPIVNRFESKVDGMKDTAFFNLEMECKRKNFSVIIGDAIPSILADDYSGEALLKAMYNQMKDKGV